MSRETAVNLFDAFVLVSLAFMFILTAWSIWRRAEWWDFLGRSFLIREAALALLFVSATAWTLWPSLGWARTPVRAILLVAIVSFYVAWMRHPWPPVPPVRPMNFFRRRQ